MNTSNRLCKDKAHSKWAGVLAGIANHLDVDPALIRIGYCVFTLCTGFFFGLFVYFIMMACIPEKE